MRTRRAMKSACARAPLPRAWEHTRSYKHTIGSADCAPHAALKTNKDMEEREDIRTIVEGEQAQTTGRTGSTQVGGTWVPTHLGTRDVDTLHRLAAWEGPQHWTQTAHSRTTHAHAAARYACGQQTPGDSCRGLLETLTQLRCECDHNRNLLGVTLGSKS